MRLLFFLLLGLAPALQAQTSFSNVDRATPETRAALPAVTVEKPARRAQPVAPRAEPVAEEPRGNVVLRTGDSFQLLMSGMPMEDAAAFPREYTIGQDGMINITYAGQIRAAGLSQSQLERAIEERLVSAKIFRAPTATINVQAGARFVTVGGQLRSPNRLQWSQDLTLLSAISACGGPSDFATKKVNVIRNKQFMTYDYYKLRKNPADDPKLLPGDQVDFL
jgi:protein involved in polysaccharide export with SLBB domain